jgi:cytochrome b6-f complex subunit 8
VQSGALANPGLGLVKVSAFACITMLFTLAWASLAAVFSFSIAMVVWGRNGDGTLNFF